MVHDEYEMENQGYEEEQQPSTRAQFNRRYLIQGPTAIAENPRSSPISQGLCAIGAHARLADPEAHVYEDIAVSCTKDSISKDDDQFRLPTTATANNNNNNSSSSSSSSSSIVNNKNNNNSCNGVDSSELPYRSKNLSQDNKNNRIRSLPANGTVSLPNAVSDNSSNFRRNLTLPLRKSIRGIDVEDGVSRFSVRVTNTERNRCSGIENDSSMGRARMIVDAGLGKAMNSLVDKPERRRRKKDCKHCKNKTNANGIREDCSTRTSNGNDTSFSVDVSQRIEVSGREDEKTRLALEPIFPLANGRLPSFNIQRPEQRGTLSDHRKNPIFSISNDTNGSCPMNGTLKLKPLDYCKKDTDVRLVPVELPDNRALITPRKNRGGTKVNSIYSQDHWCSKDVPVFVTDIKEQSPLQRAYSLPTRTQTPSSQNRVNLRRSARGEPPPHPARLRKNRHGWTLHFARPLDGTGCTRSIVLLLIAVLALLGIGGIALYIVFEPEKLQIIQQYLRSSTRNTSTESNATFEDTLVRLEATEATTLPMASVFFTESPPAFPLDTTLSPETKTETETDLVPTTFETERDPSATRHCDDCYDSEVCVSLVDEEVPICRIGPDPLDPTGCAGLCVINKQKCHRLDVDAFRCVEVEHYCLDDEWTCSNTLCIPLVKHCDGHMNCYDHSDEYDCACDLQTHFQCGNETSCLPLERRCDGKIDCWDATDEINCTLACPSSSEFTCSNGECILKARFCDGLRDCTDGSDEPHGCQGRCNKHEFSCLNGRCITKGMKCNGVDDCGDDSDEQHCRGRIYKKPIS